jgi:Zn-finger nucleic acid-binding protein
MKCPVCSDVDLVMSDRAGVEIDYCPRCRGVWLDRGELDKILERAQREEQQYTARPAAREPERGRRDDDEDRDRREQEYKYKKHKPWWKELFD